MINIQSAAAELGEEKMIEPETVSIAEPLQNRQHAQNP